MVSLPPPSPLQRKRTSKTPSGSPIDPRIENPPLKSNNRNFNPFMFILPINPSTLRSLGQVGDANLDSLTVTVRECASTNYSAAEKTSLEVEKVKSVLSERLLIHIRTCIRRRHLSTWKGATGTPPTTIVATNGV